MFAVTARTTPFLIVIVLLVLPQAAIKVLREYERAVVFTLGRFSRVSGPGLILDILDQKARISIGVDGVNIATG